MYFDCLRLSFVVSECENRLKCFFKVVRVVCVCFFFNLVSSTLNEISRRIVVELLSEFLALIFRRSMICQSMLYSRRGGGVLPYMGYIGMCGPKGYGFSAVLVINKGIDFS